jgi:uncharacterized protein
VSDLIVNISKLSEGTHRYSFEVRPENLLLDGRFVELILVDATIDKTGRQLFLKSDIRTKATLTCDRCLAEFQNELAAQYRIVYITDDLTAKEEEDAEIQFLSPDANLLDLGEDVRQFLLLAIPQKILCREECKGLCPECGTNRNVKSCECAATEVDPRWDALRKISLN